MLLYFCNQISFLFFRIILKLFQFCLKFSNLNIFDFNITVKFTKSTFIILFKFKLLDGSLTFNLFDLIIILFLLILQSILKLLLDTFHLILKRFRNLLIIFIQVLNLNFHLLNFNLQFTHRILRNPHNMCRLYFVILQNFYLLHISLDLC